MSTHLLEITNLKKTYPIYGKMGKLFTPKEHMCAVDDMSFYIDEGETYGLVGESGCGKSTTGRAIVGLNKVDSGSILYDGQDLCKLNEREFRPLRQDLQMVFQDTLSALNPRKRVGEILEETLKLHGMDDAVMRREQVISTLQRVGLSEEHYFRYPHELSGGQVQRLGIAGALIIRPKLIVCDEPVSALDVSIQAQILNMLQELKEELRISLLFISHDIGVVRFVSDRVGVMYLGTLMEEAETESLFGNPLHPYTQALLAAVPDPYIRRREFTALSGEQPVRTEKFAGCAFCTRCPYVMERCRQEAPKFREVEKGHKVACHRIQ
ncbi:MAG: ATP-binding cassette domain-containing protein [Eubacteriales bacterium]|nr:ATP-binding cassette domain-containing protein [Eubacteriales bacterium]